jgi:hypothetical protein
MIPAQRKELSRSRRRPPMIVDTSTRIGDATITLMRLRRRSCSFGPVSNAAPGSAWRLFSNLT